ncbi:NAD(P)-dependent alcohol dehydrogenase [Gemmatimonas sp.]|uniref:NAD(P)-dependent alcohol dehydrogenase n=1 Tax=Gemmatimonas sp. TaxID=1962908 RepID=UPI00356756B9
MIDARGYSAADAQSRLSLFRFEREEGGPHDVTIDVLYCGVCHSDIHQARNEWKNTVYPCVPGHEVVGRVSAVGANVTRHALGDLVGVGCMIDSCRSCEPCTSAEENYCEGPNSWLATYNGPMVPTSKATTGENMYGRDNSYGGYSNVIVVSEKFVLSIPAALKPEVAAPILCAGATTFSALKYWGVSKGQRVGVVGFGGLGDMAAKLAKAMGADVTVFTRTSEKLQEAARFGVTGVLEHDTAALQKLSSAFDFIISTVPERHDVNPFVKLLKRGSTLCVAGALEPMSPVNNQDVAFHRRSVAGSLIASLADTQEVLEFCAEHAIGPDVEVIRMQDINAAYDRVTRGDVRFRFVIDMSSLTESEIE